MMLYECFYKPFFGRRIRKITSTTGLTHVFRNLWTSYRGCHGVATIAPVTAWIDPVLQPIAPSLPFSRNVGDTIILDFDFHGLNIPAGGKTVTIVYSFPEVLYRDITTVVDLAAGLTPSQAVDKIVTELVATGDFHVTRGPGTTINMQFTDPNKLTLIDFRVTWA